jgi:hypothetical protein
MVLQSALPVMTSRWKNSHADQHGVYMNIPRWTLICVALRQQCYTLPSPAAYNYSDDELAPSYKKKMLTTMYVMQGKLVRC